jgi:hypothetical protein
LTDRVSAIDPLQESGECPDDIFVAAHQRKRHEKNTKKGAHRHHHHQHKHKSEDEGTKTRLPGRDHDDDDDDDDHPTKKHGSKVKKRSKQEVSDADSVKAHRKRKRSTSAKKRSSLKTDGPAPADESVEAINPRHPEEPTLAADPDVAMQPQLMKSNKQQPRHHATTKNRKGSKRHVGKDGAR